MAMSMRSRGAAAAINRSRSGVRPVYEDFKPSSEWKHEDGADLLLIHLPGFVKQQIRILAESKGVLRVRGERLIAGNKWSRFQEQVVVPQDCNMHEIRAKFEEGILIITMPKRFITTHKKHPREEQSTTKPEPPSTSIRKPFVQPKGQQLQEDLPPTPKLGLSELKPKRLPEEYLPKDTLSNVPQNPNDLVGTKATTPPLRPLGEPKHSQIIQEEIYEETFNYNKPNDEKYGRTQKDIRDNVEHNQDEHKSFLPNIVKQNEIKEKNKEVAPNMKERNYVYADAPEQVKGKNEFMDYKGVTIPRGLDEDRQLLVNMGVAVLVIVALGSYISYSVGSSMHAKD